MSDSNDLEEGTREALDFEKLRKVGAGEGSVLPVVLQHAETGEVLYVAYANELALRESLKTRRAVLWSTSRNELWRKGESSGDILDLVECNQRCHSCLNFLQHSHMLGYDYLADGLRL